MQSYMGVQRFADPSDGLNNDIDTRDKLRSYDSGLHNFIQELFPCNNDLIKRCDKNRGDYLKLYKTNRPMSRVGLYTMR